MRRHFFDPLLCSLFTHRAGGEEVDMWLFCELAGGLCSLNTLASEELTPKSVCSLSIHLGQARIPMSGCIQCDLNGLFVYVCVCVLNQFQCQVS